MKESVYTVHYTWGGGRGITLVYRVISISPDITYFLNNPKTV